MIEKITVKCACGAEVQRVRLGYRGDPARCFKCKTERHREYSRKNGKSTKKTKDLNWWEKPTFRAK